MPQLQQQHSAGVGQCNTMYPKTDVKAIRASVQQTFLYNVTSSLWDILYVPCDVLQQQIARTQDSGPASTKCTSNIACMMPALKATTLKASED